LGAIQVRSKVRGDWKKTRKRQKHYLRWIKAIRYRGIKRFVKEKKEAKRKRKRRCLDTITVRRIKAIRDEYGWCGEKIRYWLELKYGVAVSRTSVYRVLGRYYNLRPGWKKNRYRGKPIKAEKPREFVQIDSVDLGELFLHVGIDTFTREVGIAVASSLESKESAICLPKVMSSLNTVRVSLIQTDEGPEYKDKFKKVVTCFADRHRYARPYKKNDQAYVESVIRSIRKECVGWGIWRREEKESLEGLIEEFLIHYNTERPHLSLGMKTPKQALEEYKLSHLP
jgi:transposase InsO family protein